jgi:hypothetical protein
MSTWAFRIKSKRLRYLVGIVVMKKIPDAVVQEAVFNFLL